MVFVAASVSTAMAMAFPCGGLSPGVAWTSLAIGLLAAAFAWRVIPPEPPRQPTPWDVLLLTVFSLASLRAFLWLIYPVGDEWRVLSPNNLGDISLHIQMIRYLAGGTNFWPASPILEGASLTYPLGVDLFNSLLLCTGVPVERGLLWVGLCGAALSGWALWRWGGAFAIAALIFNGGLAGFLFFRTGQIADFQAELAWKNLFLSMFVTQRGLLYALPCGLFLLTAWRKELFGETPLVPRWVTLLLYATMPLFSAHTFVFLSLVLACAFVVRPGSRRQLSRFVGAAFVPASAAMYFVTGKFSTSSGLRWHPGWMQGNEGVLFWLWNFGVAIPLLLLLAWHLVRKRKPEEICFAGTGLIVFLICCLVSFAPWDWDNTKLFLWAWLACAPFLWNLIEGWPSALRATACAALFFSGAISLAGGLDGRHGYKLINRTALDDARAALEKIPSTARIAIEPEFNNPVILLGRPVYCGYEGHLWSHGLNYRKHWDDLQVVLKKDPGWKDTLGTLEADWFFLQGPPPKAIPLGTPVPSVTK